MGPTEVIRHLVINVMIREDPDAACGFRAHGMIGSCLDEDIIEEMSWMIFDRLAGWKAGR